MRLLLSEPVPLRTTRQLGDFAEARALPHRYGDLRAARFALIRLSATEFLAADHDMAIDAVYVDDEKTLTWEQRLNRDDDGHQWTTVLFGSPIDQSATVSATGTGKRNRATGALLQNPAEIMEDVLALCGRGETFPELRAEAAAAGLVLAGSLTQSQSIRAQLDEIACSAGAIWTPSSSRLYPAAQVSGRVIDLEPAEAGGLSVSAVIADTCDVLRLAYDVSDASGRPQRYMELTASPQRFGGVVAEIELPWLRTAANAEALGTRMLKRMAGERYRVEFRAERIDIRPGQWVRLVGLQEWPIPGPDPVLMVLSVDVELGTRSSAVAGEVVLATPDVAVTSHSVGLPDTSDGGVDVSFRNGIATFTVRDQDGKPVAGARVTLDGGDPKRTDEQGRVSFSARQGPHELLIEATGMLTQRIEFEL